MHDICNVSVFHKGLGLQLLCYMCGMLGSDTEALDFSIAHPLLALGLQANLSIPGYLTFFIDHNMDMIVPVL